MNQTKCPLCRKTIIYAENEYGQKIVVDRCELILAGFEEWELTEAKNIKSFGNYEDSNERQFLRMMKKYCEGKGGLEEEIRDFYKEDVPPVAEMMLNRLRQKYSDTILPRVKEIYQKKEYAILLNHEELEALDHRQIQIIISLKQEFL